MIFTGTDTYSYVQNHAYYVIKAVELNINGTPTKMVQMRNPWGSHNWKGKFSDKPTNSAYKADYENLKTALGSNFKEEGGKFWMAYSDWVKEYSRCYMGYTQESRTSGGAEHTQWRQTIQLPTSNPQYVRFTVFD